MCKERGGNSERDLFENAYFQFVDALETLADDAEGQCARLGNFNVASETKDDVVRGARILNLPESDFTPEEREEIFKLVEELNVIPNSLLVFVTGSEDNLKAMKNPIWSPLRKHASYLLELLAKRTKENRKYFGLT